jgi:pilus assembly protein Flp/PilA
LRRILRAIATWESPMRALYTRLIKDNAGVTAIEYGLIAALVAVVCIAAWKLLGTDLSTSFSNVAGSV